MRSPRIVSAIDVIELTVRTFVRWQATREIRRFPDDVVEVEILNSKGVLCQEAPHPPDDFAGASVIPQDIANDLVQFGDVRARRFQNCLCGFGVGQNSAERLVDFMSN